MDLVETNSAIQRLLGILKCEACSNTLHEPFLSGACEHVVCRKCLGYSTKNVRSYTCRVCKVPYRPGDIISHPHLSQIVVAARRLEKLTCSDEAKENKPVPAFMEPFKVATRSKKAPVPIASPEQSRLTDLDTTIEMKAKPVSTRQPNLVSGNRKLNSKGETLLHRASIKGDLVTLKSLVFAGHELNARDNAGWTALHEAALRGFDEVVRELIKAGAQLDVQAGPDLETPLAEAIHNARLSTVKILLEAGANPYAENIHSVNCFQLAERLHNASVLAKEQKAGKRTPKQRGRKSLEAATDFVRLYSDICSLLDEHKSSSQLKTTVNLADSVLNAVEPANRPHAATFLERRRLRPVFLASGINRVQRTLLNKVASMVHAVVHTSISPEVTHLIMNTTSVVDDANDEKINKCPRTLKFLQAILQGCWIVTFEWIEQCAHFKQRVDEEAFEVTSCSKASPTSQAPRRARLAMEGGANGLFHAWRMSFLGQFSYPLPGREELIGLARVGKATVHHRDVSTTQRLAFLACDYASADHAALDNARLEPLLQTPVRRGAPGVVGQGDECWMLAESGKGPSKEARWAAEQVLSNGPLDHRSFLVVYAPRPSQSDCAPDESLLKLCRDACLLLKPSLKISNLPAPIRMAPANWLLDCVAEYAIVPFSH